VSLFDKCRQFTRPRELQDAGLFPYFHAISDTNHGAEVTMEGRRVVMIGSNNYLGLTHHPKVQAAAHDAIREFGTGCSGSRFLNGTLELHHRLEEALAGYFRKEAALVFSTGFQTNVGVLSVIAGRDDVIFCDRENHASIFDGARLSFAPIRKYRHNDMDDLERLLAEAPPERGKLIVSDGVFSMLGDLVNLPRMKELADRYGAHILIDDAHGVGVLGEDGRGTASHFGIDVDIVTGTFSKSLASLGGFVVGAREVIEYVKYVARPMIFSAAMTPANAAAALAALDVMQTEPEHMDMLRGHVSYMRSGFLELGYDVGETSSAIIPLRIGEDHDTFVTWRRLFDEGVFTNAVVAPAVPPGQAMLRTSYMASHRREHLDRCLEVFSRVGEELHLVP
jgi:8-amino-7-oxononanoate synthase